MKKPWRLGRPCQTVPPSQRASYLHRSAVLGEGGEYERIFFEFGVGAVVPRWLKDHEQRRLLSTEARRCLQRAEEASDPNMKHGWLTMTTEYQELARVLEERQKRKD